MWHHSPGNGLQASASSMSLLLKKDKSQSHSWHFHLISCHPKCQQLTLRFLYPVGPIWWHYKLFQTIAFYSQNPLCQQSKTDVPPVRKQNLVKNQLLLPKWMWQDLLQNIDIQIEPIHVGVVCLIFNVSLQPLFKQLNWGPGQNSQLNNVISACLTHH